MKKQKNYLFFLGIVFLLCGFTPADADKYPPLDPYGHIEHKGLLDEGSAFLKSPNLENVFWSLNDSNNKPMIFAFDGDGRLIIPQNLPEDTAYKGISVSGAKNTDWEAIAADKNGNLIICDAGNNKNKRKNLSVYIFPEPDPSKDLETKPVRKVDFEYPDQTEFPPRKNARNFDSEACFWRKGKLYILTKHRGDTRTKLYMFPSLKSRKKQRLKLLGDAEVGGMVTDAAISPSGKKLAVLTYYGAFIFEKPFWSKNILSGKKRIFQFSAGQCEGITFIDENVIIVSNESGELFRLDASSFEPVIEKK